MAVVLDGKALAEGIRADIRRRAVTLGEGGLVPTLAVVLVGEDPASLSYVTAKSEACTRAGIRSVDIRLPATSTQSELLGILKDLNSDPSVHGILVQLPLPEGIDEETVIASLSPVKDVDGAHPENLGRILRGTGGYPPCTPAGIVRLLAHAGVRTSGAHVVIVGRSLLVGRPLSILLSRKSEDGDATVTLCHSRTVDLAKFTAQADILVAAVGKPRCITADMVREGAVIIDVGVNRVADTTKKSGFRLVGDVDFEAVLPKASAITPVPGGVGPLTITMLLDNTLRAAAAAAGPRAGWR